MLYNSIAMLNRNMVITFFISESNIDLVGNINYKILELFNNTIINITHKEQQLTIFIILICYIFTSIRGMYKV